MKVDIKKAVVIAGDKLKTNAVKHNEKLVSFIDKNGDGVIDREDFGLGDEQLQEAKEAAALRAVSAGKAIERGRLAAEKALDRAKYEKDLKTLRPVFGDDLQLLLPGNEEPPIRCGVQNTRMVSVVPRDKKHEDSEACLDSVGYWTTVKGMEILNIYEDCAYPLGFNFYPTISQTIYYADPCQLGLFVSLDNYFDYMKIVRVSELQMIAHQLGAKRFKVAFKEMKKSIVKKSVAANVNAAKLYGAHANYDCEADEYSNIEIAAEMICSGHEEPSIPQLTYLKNEAQINTLIQMRVGNPQNKLGSQTYVLKCNQSSGIKEQEAAKIDAVLSQLKCTGTATLLSEAQRESRTMLEYTIEF